MDEFLIKVYSHPWELQGLHEYLMGDAQQAIQLDSLCCIENQEPKESVEII